MVTHRSLAPIQVWRSSTTSSRPLEAPMHVAPAGHECGSAGGGEGGGGRGTGGNGGGGYGGGGGDAASRFVYSASSSLIDVGITVCPENVTVDRDVASMNI